MPARRPVSRGDIVLVAFPFTDLSTTKRRPAVVLSADQNDFTLAFISSRDATALAVGEVALLPAHPEFPLSGLSTPSKIRAAKLVTLNRSLIARRLGRIGPLWTADLSRALVAVLGISTVFYREEGRQRERQRLKALHGTGGTASVLADLGLPHAP
ncbi:MAG TPA: type II toxin-antitoxin system PemK/MazF family toxin [Armatimonadota bacterium]|nr:type II toxin-antitoxin system PemK/MazF family toxin [Armatimonadota bacterium]